LQNLDKLSQLTDVNPVQFVHQLLNFGGSLSGKTDCNYPLYADFTRLSGRYKRQLAFTGYNAYRFHFSPRGLLAK
jgi:hypothetical protein